MEYSSKIFEQAINQFSKLPGVGKKTALRFVLHLLKQNSAELYEMTTSIKNLKDRLYKCRECMNVSDSEICSICSNDFRNKNVICVVENIRDVIAIENTKQFSGTYHVLEGLISPLDGVGPEQINIQQLITRIEKQKNLEEIIFALNPNIQGDTTIFYIKKLIHNSPIKMTSISRGISFGSELEYADDLTLARSITNRLPIERYVKN